MNYQQTNVNRKNGFFMIFKYLVWKNMHAQQFQQLCMYDSTSLMKLLIYNYKLNSNLFIAIQMKIQKTKHAQKNQIEEYKESYQIDDSTKSATIIKIRKIKEKIVKNPPINRLHQQNPYVFVKKSYSTKRDNRQVSNTHKTNEKITKKIKLENIAEERKEMKVHQTYKINVKTVSSYFKVTFFQPIAEDQRDLATKNLYNSNSLKLFPSNIKLTEPSNKINQKMMKQIQIITNDNAKIKVPIHTALLNATNPIKLQEGKNFLDGIPNKFNLQKRDQYFQKILFMKDYRSGYAPIELQQNNQTEANKNTGKSHFIRKKQSTLSLPRTCGVSYIKKSESIQGPPFSPLPPLIFQCSSGCSNQNQIKSQDNQILLNWFKYIQNCWLLFIQSDQDNMRNLLLGEKKGKIRYVKGLINLWPLITEGVFILVAVIEKFKFNQKQIWQQFHKAEIKIGILAKKSTSGKKSFFKSVGIQTQNKPNQEQKDGKLEDAEITQITIKSEQKRQITSEVELKDTKETKQQPCKDQCETFLNQFAGNRTVITLSIRLEMYVKQQKWHSYDRQTKNLLNVLIRSIKNRLQSRSLEIIKKRFNLANAQNKRDIILQQLKNIRGLNEVKFNDLIIPQKMDLEISPLDKNSIINMIKNNLENSQIHQQEILKSTSILSFQQFLDKKSQTTIQKSFCLKMPLYYISTRDSFAFDLITKQTIIEMKGRKFLKTQYFFDPENLPTNFGEFKKIYPNNDVGIITYNNFFTEEELKGFENRTFETEKKAFLNSFLQMTVQPTISGTKIRRTKFFFGYRYMWTRCQLAQPYSYVGAGVRKDVTPPPNWIKDIQNPLVECGIVEKNFINSVAINVYHDGKQGLAQHFDDAVRFKQPIYTLRLFSDARLSFGSQFYGFCNGAFVLPLKRGCICVMTENSYAANGVKHCVRPCDMTGKSAAVILRQMHSLVTSQVDKYDQLIDFPSWFSTLSTEQNSMSYAEQKKREAQYHINVKETKIKVPKY